MNIYYIYITFDDKSKHGIHRLLFYFTITSMIYLLIYLSIIYNDNVHKFNALQLNLYLHNSIKALEELFKKLIKINK